MSMHEVWPGFADTLGRAKERTGLDDSVTFRVTDDPDAPTAVIVTGHFSFLGGSMGVNHGDVVIDALDEAIRRRCAVVFVTSSGGARTQEGFDALFQMPRVGAAVLRVRRTGMPVISVFRHPTTGGVHASYGAAADVIIAEVEATVGFAGPRVLEALTGTHVEHGRSHSADVYHERGLVDEIVPSGEGLRAALAWVRRLAPGSFGGAAIVSRSPDDADEIEQQSAATGWAAVSLARSPMRPAARRVASFLLTDLREIRGDRTGTDDPVVIAGFGRFAGIPVAVIGTDRDTRGVNGGLGAPHASGFRKAARAVSIASRLGLPVLSIIDTRGADATAQSDNSGLTAAISGLMLELLECTTPTVGAVTGEGGSGGAMAFASTDSLIMQSDSVFEVIAPEGAAAILYREPGRADVIADQMALDAAYLHRRGFVDQVVPGPTAAGVFPSLALLRRALRTRLGRLLSLTSPSLEERRRTRYI